MANVLSDYVRRGVLTTPEAIKIVEDIFFNNSNKLYNLQLNFRYVGVREIVNFI